MEHFIDSTGVVSWRFFSARSEYEFSHWDFSGTNQEEADRLFGILEDLGKEVYMAIHVDLGAPSVVSWYPAIPRSIRWKTWCGTTPTWP